MRKALSFLTLSIFALFVLFWVALLGSVGLRDVLQVRIIGKDYKLGESEEILLSKYWPVPQSYPDIVNGIAMVAVIGLSIGIFKIYRSLD